jgi:Domain of unknown function (DUF4158)
LIEEEQPTHHACSFPDPRAIGFALQLSTVRYLGTFLDDPVAVPSLVVQTLGRQLGISKLDRLPAYQAGKQRWECGACWDAASPRANNE